MAFMASTESIPSRAAAEPLPENLQSVQPGGGFCYRVELAWGRWRRWRLAHFRPACYLTDEWGCPSGEPIIGIPFYLADPKLAALEKGELPSKKQKKAAKTAARRASRGGLRSCANEP